MRKNQFLTVKNSILELEKNFARCEIMVGHRACPTNLAQRLIEKRFLLLNVRTMSDENLFVVKPQ